MTFSVLLIKENKPQVVGTLWASDERDAEALAPAICTSTSGAKVSVRRTEDREIPFRLNEGPRIQFC